MNIRLRRAAEVIIFFVLGLILATTPVRAAQPKSLSETEVYRYATLVYLEAGNQSYECQLAVASVIYNRMEYTGKSLYEVIYAKNQFTPASRLEKYSPSDSAMKAVRQVLKDGPTLPLYVQYFREGYYHSRGDQRPYIKLGRVCFSYSSQCRDKVSRGLKRDNMSK